MAAAAGHNRLSRPEQRETGGMNRRRFMTGLASGGAALFAAGSAHAFQQPLRPYRGLYRPPGFPRLANDPLTEFLADAWHFDGSAYDVTQGPFGAPLWGLSLRGYPYRTQFAAFSPVATTAGQACGFNGSSQYIWTSIGAARGPWATSPAQQTMLVVAQLDGMQPAAQTLFGIGGHAVPRRASLQIAANSTSFFIDWTTTTATTGTFPQSVVLGQPFAAALTLDYPSGTASMFFGQTKSTITGAAKAVNQWDEANFGNSIVAGTNEANYLNGALLFAAAWNTVLADQAVFDLLQNPFGFLVFPDDEMMAEMVGVAAAARSLRNGAHGFPR
ncbi:MAG: twin-arginine translocation signal domain-containing protein [Stellaceae bacterium]